MQVSVVSADYSQISKALDSNKTNCNKTDIINGTCYQVNNAESKQQKITNAILEWKNFCHQQILKGKLDIIA